MIYSSQLLAQTLPKLYINFVSHNEANYPYQNDASLYYQTRDKFIEMAMLCQSKGAKWQWQSDYALLLTVLKYDAGSVLSNTGGENVMKYITQTYPDYIQCNPHSHESVYNYSDVAKLHDSLGVDPGLVMGGFVYDQVAQGADWQIFQNPVQGKYFPSYTWAPEILWGASKGTHTDDPENYGMWKPKSMTDFFTHESNNHLINYGMGCKISLVDTAEVSYALTKIKKILDAIQAGTVPSNGFYTASIFFQEYQLINSDFINITLPALMDSINVYVANGQMEWQFVSDISSLWKSDYVSQPYILDCDSIASGTSVPNSVVYCSSSGNTTYEYINKVTLGSALNNTSGNNNGYGDFTSGVVNVLSGNVYSILVKPGFASQKQKEYYSVWIDYNQDGDFDDSGENVCKGTKSVVPFTAFITMPSTAAGQTRMRVSMKYGGYPTSCETIARGEVEDYTINISLSTPVNLISNIGENFSEESFVAFPNPADESIRISFELPAGSIIKLNDLQGREIYTHTLSQYQSLHDINTYSVVEGIYFLSLKSNDKINYQKIIIKRF
jgi:hypothetical protein